MHSLVVVLKSVYRQEGRYAESPGTTVYQVTTQCPLQSIQYTAIDDELALSNTRNVLTAGTKLESDRMFRSTRYPTDSTEDPTGRSLSRRKRKKGGEEGFEGGQQTCCYKSKEVEYVSMWEQEEKHFKEAFKDQKQGDKHSKVAVTKAREEWVISNYYSSVKWWAILRILVQ